MNNLKLKRIFGHYRARSEHWVGDGFPVRTIFSSQQMGSHVSPFVLMDYGGPIEFPPSGKPRGVDEHPHKGFETVTIMYQGELEHRDSTGNSGKIGPGDVQWMTAGAGIVHEEKHSTEFTRRGGAMEMVQLWVNLPAKDKTQPPSYQTLLKSEIPVIDLPGHAGMLRVVAGEFQGQKGPARTFTQLNVWDIRLNNGSSAEMQVQSGTTTMIVVLHGNVIVNEAQKAGRNEMVLLEREGERTSIKASQDSTCLLLNGVPIDEPIVSYGPFVMNTREEITQAIEEYHSGQMGHLVGVL